MKSMLPSGTSITGCLGSVRSAFTSSTSLIRRTLASDMLIITTHHGEHHQTHQQRHNVAEQAGQITGGSGNRPNKLRAEPGYGDNTEVNRHHHGRVVESKKTFRFHGQIVQHFGGFGKFHIFIILPDESLHHTDGCDVLPGRWRSGHRTCGTPV